MTSKLPEVFYQLRPVQEMLEALNDHLRVEDFFFAEDDSEVDMQFRDVPDGTNPLGEYKSNLDDLTLSLLTAAGSMLPEGFVVRVEAHKFVLARMTLEEQEAMEEYLAREAGPSGEVKPFTVKPFCYRIPKIIRFDSNGEPGSFYGHVSMIFPDGEPSEIDLARKERYECAWLADRLVLYPDDIIPISVEEYLANGGKLED